MISNLLYLASTSPRRKELLNQLGYQFEVVAPSVDEVKRSDESPEDYVVRLAKQKSQAGLALVGDKTDTNNSEKALVLGADTIVVYAGQVLEKPTDFLDAQRMLSLLSGNKHQVMTAVALSTGKLKTVTELVTTDVWFKPLTEREISDYWLSGEPFDKAGSYAIQGLGGRFVTRLEGSYYAVVGLPLYETEQLIKQTDQSIEVL